MIHKSDYIGYMSLSNTTGICIIGFIEKTYDTYVKLDIVAYKDICSTHTLKIYHSKKGDYFNLFKIRIYLNEFVRVI